MTMSEKQSINLLSVVLVIFAIMVVSMVIYILTQRSIPKTFPLPTGLTWLANVDLDQNNILDEQSLVKGNDGVITINTQNPKVIQIINMYYSRQLLTSPTHLTLNNLDMNQDGIINALDPLYHYLELITYDPKTPEIIAKPLDRSMAPIIRLKQLNPSNQDSAVLTNSQQILVEPAVKGN